MFLAVDIGNSATKFGLFDGDRLTEKFSIPTIPDSSADDLKHAVDGRLDVQIESAYVCSVVLPQNDAIREFLSSTAWVEPVFVENSFDFGFKINYEPLESLGTDRLVNAYAAVEKHGAPCIVCSLGTATTIDVVSADREFVGGIIAPGLDAMAEALHIKAPRLPRVDIDGAPELLGKTTPASIQSGIYHGYVAMVEGLITRVRSASGVTTIVGTGGNAARVAEEFAGMMTVDVDLLLEGLRILSGKTSTDWNAGGPPATSR